MKLNPLISLFTFFILNQTCFAGELDKLQQNNFLSNFEQEMVKTNNPMGIIEDNLKIIQAQKICLDLYQGSSWDSVMRSQAKEVTEVEGELAKKFLVNFYSALNVHGVAAFCPENTYIIGRRVRRD